MGFVRCRRVEPCLRRFAHFRRWKYLDSETNNVKTVNAYHMKFCGTPKECNTFTSQPLDIPSPCTWTSFPITDVGCLLLDAMLVRFGGHSEIPSRWPDEGLRSQQGLGKWKRPSAKNITRQSFWDEYISIYILPTVRIRPNKNSSVTYQSRGTLYCQGMLLLQNGWSGGEKKGIWEERGWSITICHRGRVW